LKTIVNILFFIRWSDHFPGSQDHCSADLDQKKVPRVFAYGEKTRFFPFYCTTLFLLNSIPSSSHIDAHVYERNIIFLFLYFLSQKSQRHIMHLDVWCKPVQKLFLIYSILIHGTIIMYLKCNLCNLSTD